MAVLKEFETAILESYKAFCMDELYVSFAYDWDFWPGDQRIIPFSCFGRYKPAPKGNGALVLAGLCQLADLLHLPVVLFTRPEKLVTYYNKFGFVFIGWRHGQRYMIRNTREV